MNKSSLYDEGLALIHERLQYFNFNIINSNASWRLDTCQKEKGGHPEKRKYNIFIRSCITVKGWA